MSGERARVNTARACSTEKPLILLGLRNDAMVAVLLDQIQFLRGHVSIQTTERDLGGNQKLRCASNDHGLGA